MAKKRKRRPEQGAEEPDSALPKVAPVATALRDLLQNAGLSKVRAEAAPKHSKRKTPPPVTMPPPGPEAPRPVPQPAKARAQAPLSAGELSAWNEAYRGVAPLGRPKRGRVRAVEGRSAVAADPSDTAEKARLEALVGQAVRFELERDEGFVRAVRAGGSQKPLRRLGSSAFHAEATLDLHGQSRAEAQRSVHDFVREAHRRGARYLLVVTGKGAHSEGGVGVLGEATVEALTRGGAAPLVLAFSSAHATLGGSGAIAVQLL